MASDDPSGPRPAAPIVIRIKLRYDDVEVMVQRFATNVGKSGLFLPTKSIQPIGAEIKFELRLADDTPVIVGLGRVKAATAPDPNNPKTTFGMAIELMRVTPQSRALILRMLERRRELGLPELGLPMVSDIDAARRAEAVNAAVRDPVSGEVPVPAVRPEAPPAPGEALLTAPRRQTGPMAVAKVLSVAPLAPEPPRRKRMAISEVIDSASGPVASVLVAVPGLDDDVDLAAAIVRARALAGGGLDAELEALCEVAAAPLEISIDAASAELARQFGGNAVVRDRSARWAPPPATTIPVSPVASPPVANAAPTQAPDAAREQAPEQEVEQAPEQAHKQAPEQEVEQAPEPAPARAPTPEHHEVEPEQIADEIHQLGELDLEDVEHTEMADIPIGPGGFDPPGDGSVLSAIDQARLAARLETQLAEAEAEADADDLGFAGTGGIPGYGEPAAAYGDRAKLDAGPRDDQIAEPPPDPDLEEFDDFEILAESDADDADLLAAYGAQEASDSHPIHGRPPAIERRASELDFAARLDLDGESDMYFAASELATQHVLDSLHEEFEDRHAHDGLHGIFDDESRLPDPHLDSAGHALAALASSEADEPFGELLDKTSNEPRGDAVGEPRGDAIEPRDFESGRGVQPIFDPEPSTTYTLAGIPSDSVELDVPAPLPPRPEPAGASRRPKDPPAVTHQEPAILRGSPPQPSLYDSPVEDHELENALEALDVNLDHLSLPRELPQPPHKRVSSRSRPTAQIRQVPQAQAPQSRVPVPTPSRAVRETGPAVPGSGRVVAPLARPPTDDGVMIEFVNDDDE